MALKSTGKRGAADRPPHVHDFDTLPAGVDVVLYPACPVENHLARLSFGNHVFRYTRRFTDFVVDIKDSYETYWNRFSSKSKWVYKTKAKKLSKACAGEITYRQCRSSEDGGPTPSPITRPGGRHYRSKRRI